MREDETGLQGLDGWGNLQERLGIFEEVGEMMRIR